jgi:hypothetical protein
MLVKIWMLETPVLNDSSSEPPRRAGSPAYVDLIGERFCSSAS